MSKEIYTVRNADAGEFSNIGQLMVQVYSQLEGFPKEIDQPDYYQMLAHVGELTFRPNTELIVAISSEKEIEGALLYFSDMQYYGSGGIATSEKNWGGFRFLAVRPAARGKGIGKLLMDRLIEDAKEKKFSGMMWQVLEWNEPAINFYKKYYNANFDDEWTNCSINF